MITLLKIRSVYLKRHPFGLCFGYLLIPVAIILLFLISIINFLNKDSIDIPDNPKKKPMALDQYSLYPPTHNYNHLRDILSNSVLLVNDKKNGEKLGNFIYNETNIQLEYYLQENEFDKDAFQNIIIYTKIEGKSRFKLKFREGQIFKIYDIDTITDLVQFKNNSRTTSYQYYKFFEFQSLLFKFLIIEENMIKSPNIVIKTGYNAFPPTVNFSEYPSNFTFTLSCFAVSLEMAILGYFFNVRMIEEKEKNLFDFLQRQGVTKKDYALSWFISFLAISSIPTISFLFLFKFIYEKYFFFYLINIILYDLSVYSVIYFFYSIISSLKSGGIIIKLYYFISIIIGYGISLPKATRTSKIIFAFIPFINIFHTMNAILKIQRFNLKWDYLILKPYKISYIESFLFFIVQIILYSGLALFIESYKNSGLNFFSYLVSFIKKDSKIINKEILNEENENEDKNILNYEIHHQELSLINQQKKKEGKYLRISRVTKEFGDLKAVNNFSCELFSNEIFCLLGHNGAGKTTLVNMISGLIAPEKGDIFLDGISILINRDFLYKNIAFCQQENIFFDYLTVQEHLQFIYEIKGSLKNFNEIQDLINNLDFSGKEDDICGTLSEGQKRKLCIALALLSGSRIIILDEPTTGLDAFSKKNLWEFLKNYQKDKILLITTHSLSEAEYLANRIGIMSEGHLICSGTSSYLKSNYAGGFNINLIINPKIFNENNKKIIFEKIQEFEPDAKIKIFSKGVFSINIQSNKDNISQIFNYIEQSKSEFGIEDYIISSASLEDVFLTVNKSNLNNLIKKKNDSILINNFNDVLTQPPNFFSQLISQLYRNLLPIWRNKFVFIFELIGSLAFSYIFIFFFRDLIFNLSSPSKSLNFGEVLESNTIWIYEDKEGYLRNSDLFNNLNNRIVFERLTELKDNITNFSNYAYDKALGNIAKSCILIVKNSNGDIEVYNTEIDNDTEGYLMANSVLIVSAILKNEFGIDATIFTDFEDKSSDKLEKNSSNFIIIGLSVIFGFLIYMGGIAYEKIKERNRKIKHLLYLSGCNMWAYWGGFFIIDFIKLIIFSILLLIPIYYFSNLGYYFLLSMPMMCVASLVYIYFFSTFWRDEDSGTKIILVSNIGFILVIFLFYIFIILPLATASNFIRNVFMNFFPKKFYFSIFDFTPILSLIITLYRISYSINVRLSNEDVEIVNGYYRPMIYVYSGIMNQLINFIIYFTLMILYELGYLSKWMNSLKIKMCSKDYHFDFSEENLQDEFYDSNNTRNPLLMDIDDIDNNIFVNTNNNINDVNSNDSNNIINNDLNDENMINENLLQNEEKDKNMNIYMKKEIEKLKSNDELTVKISNLSKTFLYCCKRNVKAINNLNLGLESNENFGLLGFNGSGKTTTFRAITNEIIFENGSISLFGFDNKKQINKIKPMIGYCPQEDPLFDYMKVKEIIEFYKELKRSTETVESICSQFDLTKYLDTYCMNLSGGNKRKLSFTIALINKPNILLLDEPSTGVDPESRRTMWRNINELSFSGHQYNMILSTHSIEEAEILCDRVSWLKKGNFICIGNPEELKLKHSNGYKLHIKFVDSVVNKNDMATLTRQNVQDEYNLIVNLVKGFNKYSNYIASNPIIALYIRELVKVVNEIKPNTYKIKLLQIEKDFSFELQIGILKEKQNILFSQILNLSKNNQKIAEVSINLESLGKILTSFIKNN